MTTLPKVHSVATHVAISDECTCRYTLTSYSCTMASIVYSDCIWSSTLLLLIAEWETRQGIMQRGIPTYLLRLSVMLRNAIIVALHGN